MKICNDLCSLVYQKLVEQNMISAHEKILLNPYYDVNLHGKQYSHYIIKCLYSKQNFFPLKYRRVMIRHHIATIICVISTMKSENIYTLLF